LLNWKTKYFTTDKDGINSFLKLAQQEISQSLYNTPINDNMPTRFKIYTTNVDSLFRKTGFQDYEIYEIYGCQQKWQCSKLCTMETWVYPDDFRFKYHMNDKGNLVMASADFPKCKYCTTIARPNVRLFQDVNYFAVDITKRQKVECWYQSVLKLLESDSNKRVVIVEIGAGIIIPTARLAGENLLNEHPSQVRLIRINPKHYPEYINKHSDRIININMDCIEALTQIDRFLGVK